MGGAAASLEASLENCSGETGDNLCGSLACNQTTTNQPNKQTNKQPTNQPTTTATTTTATKKKAQNTWPGRAQQTYAKALQT
jgi:hypothetical protein